MKVIPEEYIYKRKAKLLIDFEHTDEGYSRRVHI